jgi:hypothetical protein
MMVKKILIALHEPANSMKAVEPAMEVEKNLFNIDLFDGRTKRLFGQDKFNAAIGGTPLFRRVGSKGIAVGQPDTGEPFRIDSP